MMNCVKPTCGCPAVCSKNWSGVATLQVGVSLKQVPACQPLPTCGFSGSDGATMSPVSASAADSAKRLSQSQKHHDDDGPCTRSPTHLDLLPLDHLPMILPDFYDLR